MFYTPLDLRIFYRNTELDEMMGVAQIELPPITIVRRGEGIISSRVDQPATAMADIEEEKTGPKEKLLQVSKVIAKAKSERHRE